MKFPRHVRIFHGQVEAAPFLGVLFLLVFFLLFSSSLVFTPGVPIHLPDAVSLPGTANPTVVVAVDESGQMYFANQICNEAQLKLRLAEVVASSPTPLTLVVRADKNVKYEVVARLGLLAREAGIRESLWATRPPVAPAVGKKP